jgi:hypothetical protein
LSPERLSFSLLSLQISDVARRERTEIKRAEGVALILIVSVQCRFFIVFRYCVRWEMFLELVSLPIHLFKHLLEDQFGLASALAESRPGMFPK